MIIIACGLCRAARLTATVLIPKNVITKTTPSKLPVRPLTPPRMVLSTTMTSAAGAVTTAERRRITA